MALVLLEEGPVVTAQFTGLGDQEVETGIPFEMLLHKISSDMVERRNKVSSAYFFRNCFP
jgi:hypothetical protein